MALTKTQLTEKLSEGGIEAEKIPDLVSWIMNGHITSINALREERDNYKADAEKLPGVQKELDDLKAKGDQNWQQRYEDEHAAFETYKDRVSKQKEADEKARLYRNILEECDVEKPRIDAVMKVTDLSKLELKDGKLDDVENLKQQIQTEWAGFIRKPQKKGAEVDNPPENNGGNNGAPESRAAKIAAEYHKELYGE